MGKSRHYLKVLFSHPSDAMKYLTAIGNAFNRANKAFGELLSVHFDIFYWERDAYRSWGDAQLSINEDLVYSADIVVAVFESRLGTPIHGYESGTDEEIRIASDNGNRHIWVYFSQNGSDVAAPEERERLEKYKQTIGKLCFYSDFTDESDLAESLFQQITLYIRKVGDALKSELGSRPVNASSSEANTFNVNNNNAQNQQFIQNATFYGGNFFASSPAKGDKQK